MKDRKPPLFQALWHQKKRQKSKREALFGWQVRGALTPAGRDAAEQTEFSLTNLPEDPGEVQEGRKGIKAILGAIRDYRRDKGKSG